MEINFRTLFQILLYLVYTMVIYRIGFIQGIKETDYARANILRMYHNCIETLTR